MPCSARSQVRAHKEDEFLPQGFEVLLGGSGFEQSSNDSRHGTLHHRSCEFWVFHHRFTGGNQHLNLSAILLIGLVLNATLNWWWADPVSALIMVPIIAKEAIESLKGEVCCGTDACC